MRRLGKVKVSNDFEKSFYEYFKFSENQIKVHKREIDSNVVNLVIESEELEELNLREIPEYEVLFHTVHGITTHEWRKVVNEKT